MKEDKREGRQVWKMKQIKEQGSVEKQENMEVS